MDASYTDSSSIGDEANTQTRGCRVDDQRASKLGNRTALTIRFSCPANAYGEAYEEVLVLTVQRQGNRSPVDYQIGMRAKTPEALSQNMALFGKLVTGFRLEK